MCFIDVTHTNMQYTIKLLFSMKKRVQKPVNANGICDYIGIIVYTTD